MNNKTIKIKKKEKRHQNRREGYLGRGGTSRSRTREDDKST
jgi:hypothetical protein